MAVGVSAGLTSLASPQAVWGQSFTRDDIANGLTCCVGVVDFGVVLALKPDFRTLLTSASALSTLLEPLKTTTPKLVARLDTLTVDQTCKDFAKTTNGSILEVSDAIQQLSPRLQSFLENGVVAGQTAESVSLFVSKTFAVASLLDQTAHSMLLLRQSLQKQNISANEYNQFLESKLSAWLEIDRFLNAAKQLRQDHFEFGIAAGRAKARVDQAVVSLGKAGQTTTPKAATELADGLKQDLAPLRAKVAGPDLAVFDSTVDLLSKMVAQAGERVDGGGLLASTDPRYNGLRERVEQALGEATHGRATSWQVSIVVLAARGAMALPNLPSQKNVVASAILWMWPRLPFDPRSLTRAQNLAEAILVA